MLPRKILNYVIVILIVLSFPSTVLAIWQTNDSYVPQSKPPNKLDEAIHDANSFLGRNEFSSWNTLNKPIGIRWMVGGRHMFYYDTPSQYENGIPRYLGQNVFGELITNPDFPDDLKFVGDGKLESQNWIIRPWDNSYVKNWQIQHREPVLIEYYPYDGNKTFLPHIIKGLQLKRGDVFLNNTPKDWTQYVHIIQPPTYYGWGMGRMWHKEGNSIRYISVPLAPEQEIRKWIPNLSVKSLIPGTPIDVDKTTGQAVYMATPGRTYEATVVFKIESMQKGELEWPLAPSFVTAMHQVTTGHYMAQLQRVSGNGQISKIQSRYPHLATNGQSIVFNQKDDEIVAKFKWTAQKNTKNLVAVINDNFFADAPVYCKRLHWEGLTGTQFEDNLKSVPIKLPPDLSVKTITSSTKTTDAGEHYVGHVSYSLDAAYDKPVKAEIELTHNSFPIANIHKQMIMLNPGETKSFDFNFTGQYGNSTIEAKIRPKEPTEQDANWANNTKKLIIPRDFTDIAVVNLSQTVPIRVGTTTLATVTFKNLGTQPETFVARYSADNKLVKSETITLPKGGTVQKGFNWDAPNQAKNVELKVEADPNHTDSNPGNNIARKTVKVDDYPLPPVSCNSKTSVTSGNWSEQYYVIVAHDVYGKAIWDHRSVEYTENLSATVTIDTKQDKLTNPAHPKISDRESRGSWEIIPWAQRNSLAANKVTRAGYGFELKVTTNYQTNYETPRLYDELGHSATPNGHIYQGPTKVTAEFFDTNNRSVGIVKLVTTTGSLGDKNITWELPEQLFTHSDGTKVTKRKHYTKVDIPDGKYYVVIYMEGIGYSSLKLCQEDFVVIHGDMYDDINTKPIKK